MAFNNNTKFPYLKTNENNMMRSSEYNNIMLNINEEIPKKRNHSRHPTNCPSSNLREKNHRLEEIINERAQTILQLKEKIKVLQNDNHKLKQLLNLCNSNNSNISNNQFNRMMNNNNNIFNNNFAKMRLGSLRKNNNNDAIIDRINLELCRSEITELKTKLNKKEEHIKSLTKTIDRLRNDNFILKTENEQFRKKIKKKIKFQ